MSYVYQCSGCAAYALQPIARLHTGKGPMVKVGAGVGPPVANECEHCGKVHHVAGNIRRIYSPSRRRALGGRSRRFISVNLAGPIWSAPLHDESFVKALLARLGAKGSGGGGGGVVAETSAKKLGGLLLSVIKLSRADLTTWRRPHYDDLLILPP